LDFYDTERPWFSRGRQFAQPTEDLVVALPGYGMLVDLTAVPPKALLDEGVVAHQIPWVSSPLRSPPREMLPLHFGGGRRLGNALGVGPSRPEAEVDDVMIVEGTLRVFHRKAWTAPGGERIPEFTEFRLVDAVPTRR
jgi:hypothetical protein